MQILYCDDCGIRVDDAQETESHKVYCAKCAPKHAAEFAPKRMRPSGRAQGSGVFKAVPGTKSVNVAARAPLPPPPAEPEFIEPEAPAGLAAWVRENKPIAIGGGIAALAVIGVLAWMLVSSKGKTTIVRKGPDIPVSIPDKPTPPDNKNPDKPPEPKPPEPKPPEPKHPEPPKPPEPTKPEDTPMYRYAKTRLEGLQEKIKAGKISNYEIRKELDYFMAAHLKGTPMQVEAASMMVVYKDAMRPPDKADGTQPGVQARIGFPKGAELFGTDFKALDTKTLPAINFPTTAAVRDAFGRDADFAVKLVGFIEVPKDGTYTFYLSSDDGSTFYIGKDPLINNAGMHAMGEQDAYLDLKAGKHAFKLDYYQGTGEAGLVLSWSGPGVVKDVVPAKALSSKK